MHARIVAIADSYDAMHSDRIYRKGLANDVIRSELINGRGSQFDPELLDVFTELFEDGSHERAVKKREGELNQVRLDILNGASS